jgi:hypothetical protein
VRIEHTELGGKDYGPSIVRVGRYSVDGSLAIALALADTGEPLTKVTVWLETKPAEGCFWLQSWGANDGMALLLGRLGLVEYTGEVCQLGYVHAIEARPKGELKELIETEMAAWPK